MKLKIIPGITKNLVLLEMGSKIHTSYKSEISSNYGVTYYTPSDLNPTNYSNIPHGVTAKLSR